MSTVKNAVIVCAEDNRENVLFLHLNARSATCATHTYKKRRNSENTLFLEM